MSRDLAYSFSTHRADFLYSFFPFYFSFLPIYSCHHPLLLSPILSSSVIQPGLERAHDPALQSQFSSFLSTAQSSLSTVARTSGQVLSTGLESGSQFLKRDLGVDVGDLGAHYIDRASGRGAGEGYGRVGEEHAPRGDSSLQTGDGDFFDDHLGGAGGAGLSRGGSSSGSGTPNWQSGTNGGGFRDEDGFESMPTTKRTVTPPLAPPPQVEGDWNSFAPKAAAARAAREAAKAKEELAKKKDDDGWGDFEEF